MPLPKSGVRRDTQLRAEQNVLALVILVNRGEAARGDHEVDWPIERILATADHAVGLTLMSDLYRERRDKPVRVDLEKIWRELGVDGAPGAITLRNDAPQAANRTALTRRPTT